MKSEWINSWTCVLETFDFRWDEEDIIKELLDGWIKWIFSWISLGIIDHIKEWKSIKEKIEELKKFFSSRIEKGRNIPKALDVEKIVNTVSLKVKDILVENWFWITSNKKTIPAPIVNKIANAVSYRAYVYWILKILKSTWFDTDKLKPVDVPNETWKYIYDILRDPWLTTLLIVLQSYKVIKLSNNKWNEFSY